ncbi:glycosyltransferase family 47 protein [Flavobacteriaceae bacterium]|nr:glycosyltransferase family 47 protein [Flavobacteriaceae bacterium]
MLRLYTDTKFLTEENRKKVFPLLFDLCYLKNSELQNYYELTSDIYNSDVLIVPIDLNTFKKYSSEYKKILSVSRSQNKPLWYYIAGDSDQISKIELGYEFRLGGHQSKLSNKVITIPSFINDPYDQNLKVEFSVLNKLEKPSIGFVGYADNSLITYMRGMGRLIFYSLIERNFALLPMKERFFYGVHRAKLLEILSRDNGLLTNFILRKKYRAGSSFGSENRKITSDEFYHNIYENLFTFCIRGAGNFSVRFFQVLAMGRIPILFNTDCPLPLSDIIDWEKHILMVKDDMDFGLQITKFFDNHSEEELKTIQINNRQLWITHLERVNYFIKINQKFNYLLK